jgi:hypothetical protein
VNQAEACLASVYIASQEKSSLGAMASDLQEARGMCNDAKRYLATNNSHGFSDQNLEFFGAADEAKSATNAGLD